MTTNSPFYNFKVTDRKTFIEFLQLLHRDCLDNPQEWENQTLPDFLEATSRYAQDMQGYYANTNQNVDADTPNWSTFADILKGAKVYE